MKKVVVLFFCLLVCGCASSNVDVVNNQTPFYLSSAQRGQQGLTNIRHIHIGMTVEEVTEIMGNNLKVGYKRNEQLLGGFEPIIIKSPYKAEVLKGNLRTYEVLYYFTNVKKADGIITEDELTPFVFQGGKLVGKDIDFFLKVKEKVNS